jgi:myosin-5
VDRSLTDLTGLQTPRLKRLAEIVSAQAIAQQDKSDYGHTNGNGVAEPQGLAIMDVEGM